MLEISNFSTASRKRPCVSDISCGHTFILEDIAGICNVNSLGIIPKLFMRITMAGPSMTSTVPVICLTTGEVSNLGAEVQVTPVEANVTVTVFI